MPSFSSIGCSSEFSRLMIGRSCRKRPTPWPNWSPKHSISESNPNSSAFGQTDATWSVVTPGFISSIDLSIHSRARLYASRCASEALADDERAVVAGLVADEGLDDVEEGLVAGADEPVAEDVGVRGAALAGDGVDVVDVLAAHVEEGLGDLRHQLALADPRLEPLADELVGAIDHGAGHVQQHDLVGGLHLAGVEHGLLAVADGDVARPPARRASAARRCRRRAACRPRPRRGGCRAISLAAPVNRPASGATAPRSPIIPPRMFSGGSHGQYRRWCLAARAEVPQVRLAAAGEEREARHLVARPLPDVGARDVADVVEVEDQQGAELRCLERLADAVEPVVPQPLGVDALLPVDGLGSRGGDRPVASAAPLARVGGRARHALVCSGTSIVAPRLKRVIHTGRLTALQRWHRCSIALERDDHPRRIGRLVLRRPAGSHLGRTRRASRARSSSAPPRAPSTPSSAVTVIQPGGWLQRHFHSFEESLYVLDGELLMELDGHAHRLREGRLRALCRSGSWHALGNAGSEPVRMLSVNTPQRLPAGCRAQGHVLRYSSRSTWPPSNAAAERPPFGDPRLRWIGHYDGTPPQAEALALADPARGRRPVGRDTALSSTAGSA